MRIFTIICAILLGLCANASAAPSQTVAGKGNMEAILNAFIASIAKDDPTYKTEIELYTEGNPVPAGHQRGVSAELGDYTFRAKTWKELTPAEQQLTKKHPQLKAFLVSMRNETIYPSIGQTAGRVSSNLFPVEGGNPSSEIKVTIDPEEMVKNRPTVINLKRTSVK